MSDQPENRVRAFFEEIAPPIDVERLARELAARPGGGARWSRNLAIVVAAAVITVLVLGVSLLVGRWDDDEPATATTLTSSTTTPAPSTTVEPGTTTEATATIRRLTIEEAGEVFDTLERYLVLIRDQVVDVNEAWETRNITLNEAANGFNYAGDLTENLMDLLGPRTTGVESLQDLVSGVAEVAATIEDVILGLQAPDDGTRRRDAVAEFEQTVEDLLIEATTLRHEFARSASSSTDSPIPTDLDLLQAGVVVESADGLLLGRISANSLDPEVEASWHPGMGDLLTEVRRRLLGDGRYLGADVWGRVVSMSDGLRVVLSVDSALQERANQVMDLEGATVDGGGLGPAFLAGWAVVLDHETGGILALSGPSGHRNPGSAARAFGLVAALEQGISLNSYWDASTPMAIDTGIPGWPPWECANAGTNEPGIQTVEDAIVHATNTVLCQVAVEVGGEALADVFLRAGHGPVAEIPAIALGAAAVSPLQMAEAFATLATGGIHREPYLIARIEDLNGTVLYEASPNEGTRVFAEDVAAVTRQTLEQVITRGTGGDAALDRPAAGVTGTTEFSTDAWFAGFTPDVTAVVWIGVPRAQISMRDFTLNGVFFSRGLGGTVAAPRWREIMEQAPDSGSDFPDPPPGVERFYEIPDTTVPDVVGLDGESARSLLFGAGLDVDGIPENPTGTTVVSVDPAPGTVLPQGSTVEVRLR